MAIDDSTRLILFKIILQQSTAEGIAERRRFVRRTLERIREGSATTEEIALIRSALHQVSKRVSNVEERRRLAALAMYYLSAEPPAAQNIAVELGIVKRTVFRDITLAINMLTVAIYGVDGVEFQQ